MPKTFDQFSKDFKKEEELRRQGIETRKPVGHCTDCGLPMHESPISSDDTPDADFNPLSDVPR